MSAKGFTNTSQFDALMQIAAFSAALRGHQLIGWRETADSATASCEKCGQSVTVCRSLFEPLLHGLALEVECWAECQHNAA